ncbi:MAG: hypothetical protein ACRECW_05315 [Phyllobacterium sp.]
MQGMTAAFEVLDRAAGYASHHRKLFLRPIQQATGSSALFREQIHCEKPLLMTLKVNHNG